MSINPRTAYWESVIYGFILEDISYDLIKDSQQLLVHKKEAQCHFLIFNCKSFKGQPLLPNIGREEDYTGFFNAPSKRSTNTDRRSQLNTSTSIALVEQLTAPSLPTAIALSCPIAA
jgi:hypothetical protein